MIRSAAGKIAWMARATTVVVGLAIMLALLIGVASAAFGANGQNFILGQLNKATAITQLNGNVPGKPALRVKNPSTAAGSRALQVNVAANNPPIRVNASAGKAPNLNADKLDGKDESAFLGKTEKAADSDKLDGTDSNDLIKRGGSGSATPLGMNFYSYFMNTTSGVNDYPFGQARLRTTGTAGQFRVCGNSTAIGSFNYVAYVNGARTAGTVGTGGCSSAFDAGAGGDFRVTIRRALIFGVHSGDSTTNENYNLYGFSQL